MLNMLSTCVNPRIYTTGIGCHRWYINRPMSRLVRGSADLVDGSAKYFSSVKWQIYLLLILSAQIPGIFSLLENRKERVTESVSSEDIAYRHSFLLFDDRQTNSDANIHNTGNVKSLKEYLTTPTSSSINGSRYDFSKAKSANHSRKGFGETHCNSGAESEPEVYSNSSRCEISSSELLKDEARIRKTRSAQDGPNNRTFMRFDFKYSPNIALSKSEDDIFLSIQNKGKPTETPFRRGREPPAEKVVFNNLVHNNLGKTIKTSVHLRSLKNQSDSKNPSTDSAKSSINLFNKTYRLKNMSSLKPRVMKPRWILPFPKDNNLVDANGTAFIPKGQSPEKRSKSSSETGNFTLRWNGQGSIYSSHSNSSLVRRKRKIGPEGVEVISGSSATLPCDLSLKDPNDAVQLVLWIKQGMDTPLYSYDYRELLGGRPKETKPNSDSTLAKRTTFRTEGSQAALIIERAEKGDAGLYRCRIDFLLTPTRNSRVNLTVVVPPSRARVTWKSGASNLVVPQPLVPSEDGTIGPFKEGDAPVLICSNDDGSPPPSVKWYAGDRMIDDSYEAFAKTGVVTNTLALQPLTRKDVRRRLTCQASNSNKTQPATSTVSLGMILGILSVRIEIPSVLEAALQSYIQCQVRGSRPVPTITWWHGSEKLPASESQVMEDGNLTVSVLQFTPKAQDDGTMLICQAVNTDIKEEVVQDRKLLSVTYVPQVSVHLGRSLNPLRIKEGDDVYFECGVKAKPPVTKTEWKHNDVPLETGSGMFVSNMSLVVQRANRTNGGSYTCHATNAKGTGSSSPLYLDVKFAPVCANAKKTLYSVAKLENAEILCKVYANPLNVTFQWTFNNTAEAIDVPQGRFVVSGTVSRVNYTPMNELDYGTLLCWANNSIGVQEQPCVFQIVTAGKPDPPHNCRVFDVTISSLQVACLAGDDGGLTQQFLIQVFKIGSSSPVTEVTEQAPSFTVSNLQPATAYKLLVASLNDKGTSRPSELKAYTVKVPERQEETSAEPARDRDRDVSRISLSLVIGSSVATVPLLFGAAFVVWFRAFRKGRSGRDFEETDDERSFRLRKKGGAPPVSESNQSVSLKDSSIARSSSELPISTDSSNADDYNPDLILCTPDSTDVATLSNSSTGYFIRSGNTFSPSSGSGARQMMPGMEYDQVMSGDDNQTQNSFGIHHISLTPSPHDPENCLFLAPGYPQVPYPRNPKTGYRSSPQPLPHILELPLPPPQFYSHDAQEEHCRGGSVGGSAGGSLVGQSPISPSGCRDLSPRQNFASEKRKKPESHSLGLPLSDVASINHRIMSQIKRCPQHHPLFRNNGAGVNVPHSISSETALHYATVRKWAANGDPFNKVRNPGSLPDVREEGVKKSLSLATNESKIESDV